MNLTLISKREDSYFTYNFMKIAALELIATKETYFDRSMF